MKYSILIWASMWRKRARTVLTILSIVIAFLLYGILQGINAGLDTVISDLNVNRLYVASKVNISVGLPLAHRYKIERVSGVRQVAPYVYFGGFYQDSRNAISAFATDVATMFAVYPELKMPADQRQAIARTRNGVIIGRPLAEKYGWKIGDLVPIGTSIWTREDGGSVWQFAIVGIYETTASIGPPQDGLLINYDYFDDTRAFRNGTVHFFIVGIDDARRAPGISTAIDALFANSADESRTLTEQAQAQTMLKQVGDINFIVNSIVGAVLFTLLFLTSNTMMRSVRERTAELAVLKTIGYSDAKVVALILLEAALLCVSSALVGLTLARLIFPAFGAVLGLVEQPFTVVATGLTMALLLALISGLPPARRALRLKVVDALASR